MATTALFAEVLIIGIQGITWMMLIALSFLGHSWITDFGTLLKEFTAITTILLLAVFYAVGIIIDRCLIAFTRLYNPSKLIRSISWVEKKARETFNEENMVLIYSQEGTLELNQTYLASRLRIVRATFFNFFLILVTSIVFCTQIDRFDCIISILVIGLLLLFMTLVAYAVLEETFEDRNKKVKALALRIGGDVA